MTAQVLSADQSIALNRFGLGARAEESIPDDARAFLLDQFDHYDAAPAAFASAGSSVKIVTAYTDDARDLRAMNDAERLSARKKMRQQGRRIFRNEIAMRVTWALNTPTPFIERLVHFWSNHFAVSADEQDVVMLAGAFEREAIRPHVLGRFEDMLVAVERHAAMQYFLDQDSSIGPNSRRARRPPDKQSRKPGINENLAREILELHTLGVRAGYTQNDVVEFALALTGWGIGRVKDDRPGAFHFRQQWHEPGVRTILGHSYPQRGADQARAVLSDLARAEATATHIATKLVRHFIADEPPAGAVDTLKMAFLETDGDLPSVYRTLIDLQEAWDPRPRKFKTPWEWTISALRGCGWTDLGKLNAEQVFKQLGQPVWQPKSPAGYDDVAASWAAPDALVRRVEMSQRLARTGGQRQAELDARTLAPQLLPGTLSERTRIEISRAESQLAAMALMLVAPEFQRR